MSQLKLEDPDQTLERLSQKPGVRQILILDRKSGSVVRSSGFIDAPAAPVNQQQSPASPAQVRTPGGSTQAGAAPASAAATPSKNGTEGERKRVSAADEYARIVWAFVNAADTAVSSVDGDDDMKLLRLRTRKNEIMIMPDPKFLLVVVHDTPPTA